MIFMYLFYDKYLPILLWCLVHSCKGCVCFQGLALLYPHTYLHLSEGLQCFLGTTECPLTFLDLALFPWSG